jgi:3-phenylpropionate/trans-cinnamate dioxygenase ferredoxin component
MVSEMKVCRTDEVKPGSAKRIDVDGLRLCVVRIRAERPDEADEWYAIGDRCSHADYSLSEGDVWADDHEIECPKHGSTFDLRTGEPQSLPATQPVPVYPVRVEGDDVIVELAS